MKNLSKETKKEIRNQIWSLLLAVGAGYFWSLGSEPFIVGVIVWALLTIVHRQALKYGY